MSINYERLKNTVLKLDKNTYNHCVRVYKLAKAYEEINGNDSVLSAAALLHDIGKIYISHNILDKPFALTTLEREIINLHSYIGYQLLKDLNLKEEIAYIVCMHHGMNLQSASQYKEVDYDKLVSLAKKLHTIDAFDAMITNRPYRNSIPVKTAISIELDDAFSDPEVIDFLNDNHIASIVNKAIDIEKVLYKIAEEEKQFFDIDFPKILVPVLKE